MYRPNVVETLPPADPDGEPTPERLVPSSSSDFFMKFLTSFACGPDGARVR